MQNADDYRIKRIIYQSTHRGCKELDIILGTFITSKVVKDGAEMQNVFTLSKTELDDYEKLSAQYEWDIYSWIVGEEPTPSELALIVKKIQDFNKKYIR